MNEISAQSPKCIHYKPHQSPVKEEDFENITQRKNAFTSQNKSHSFHVTKKEKDCDQNDLMHKRNTARKSSI
jgi:hypothetical protein